LELRISASVNQATYVSTDTRQKNFDPYKLIPNIHNDHFDMKQQRHELDLIKKLDELNMAETQADPQLEATIGSMETAYRMQTEAPDVFDVRKESEATIKMYGEGSTARSCLTAARLIERGVRTVQIYYSQGDPWDAHQDIQAHRKNAKIRINLSQPWSRISKPADSSTRPSSSVVRSLAERLWSSSADPELMPVVTQPARLQHVARRRRIKGGMTYGATDDFGWKVVDKPVHVHDIHATILYLMGIDHTKLTYRSAAETSV